MIAEARAAAAFIQSYTRIMVRIHGRHPDNAQTRLVDILAAARAKYCADRSLLAPALDALGAESVAVPPAVVSAVQSLELKRWIYLKDTKAHSVFIDPSGRAAYGVLGLTDRIRDIVGGSGAIIETGLVRYLGRYVCDGIVSNVAWLGSNYKREYARVLAEIRGRGAFHKACGR